MSDIVERLRQPWPPSNSEDPLMTEAADEIERLRAALREIATYEIEDGCPCNACQHSALARAALEGK